MNLLVTLNNEQKSLVENHIDIVYWVVKKYIYINECVVGLSYEDIYQEGCYWLCKAALTYNKSVLFKTYAEVVVKNGLISYCRCTAEKHKRVSIVYIGDSNMANEINLLNKNNTQGFENIVEVSFLLESVKKEYEGIVVRGIEALQFKMQGCSGYDIAKKYGVKENAVGAWISKASKKLRQNNYFINEIMS